MRKRALIIVNEKHDDEKFAELPGAAADAEHLSGVLKAPDIGGFAEVTVVKNETFLTWRMQIQKFFTEAKHDDILLLHLSCHGRRDMFSRLRFIARDSASDMVEATAVSARFLADCMERSRSSRIVLLLDCCHSGAFTKDMRARGEIEPEVDLREEFQGTGRIVITASTALQYAYESKEPKQASVFTGTVVEGLKSGEADLDQDGYVSVDDLYKFLAQRVPEKVGDQTPTLSVTSVGGEILLARNPHAGDLPDGSPADREVDARAQAQIDALEQQLKDQGEARRLEAASHKALQKRAVRQLANVLIWLVQIGAAAAGLWTASLWADDFVLPGPVSNRVLALLLCGMVQMAGGTLLALPALKLGFAGFVVVMPWVLEEKPFDRHNSVAVRGRAGAILALDVVLSLAAIAAAFTWLPTRALLLGAWLARQAGLPVTAPSGWHGVFTSLSALVAVLLCGFATSPEDDDAGEPGTTSRRRWPGLVYSAGNVS